MEAFPESCGQVLNAILHISESAMTMLIAMPPATYFHPTLVQPQKANISGNDSGLFLNSEQHLHSHVGCICLHYNGMKKCCMYHGNEEYSNMLKGIWLGMIQAGGNHMLSALHYMTI